MAASIDYERLQTHNGTQYLLGFLKQKLGRLPVPDVGQHLDELFVKARRQPGTDVITWCTQPREAYKRLFASQLDVRRTLQHQRRQPPGQNHMANHRMPALSMRVWLELRAEDEEPQTPADGSEGVSGAGADYDYEYGSTWWHDEEGYYEEEENVWDDLETTLPDILPEEVLGWLLMRRTGLPSSAKLSAQAAAGNSLKFSEIEKECVSKKMQRPQHGRQRPQHGRPNGTFWIEDEGSWGILLAEPDDMELKGDQIQWVDHDAVLAAVGSNDQRFHEGCPKR